MEIPIHAPLVPMGAHLPLTGLILFLSTHNWVSCSPLAFSKCVTPIFLVVLYWFVSPDIKRFLFCTTATKYGRPPSSHRRQHNLNRHKESLPNLSWAYVTNKILQFQSKHMHPIFDCTRYHWAELAATIQQKHQLASVSFQPAQWWTNKWYQCPPITYKM